MSYKFKDTPSLGDILKEYIQKSPVKHQLQTMQLSDVWEQIMGKTIAGYTESLQIIGNKLIITTHIAPLKQELQYQKNKIIERVNEHMGKQLIEEIIIK